MPFVPEGAFGTTRSHDQADRKAGHYSLQVGSSERRTLASAKSLALPSVEGASAYRQEQLAKARVGLAIDVCLRGLTCRGSFGL
jgi:hypothetical protein